MESQGKGTEAGEGPQPCPPMSSTCSLLSIYSVCNISRSCFNNVLNLPALLFRAPTFKFKSLDIHKQLFSNNARRKASRSTASKTPAQTCSVVDLFQDLNIYEIPKWDNWPSIMLMWAGGLIPEVTEAPSKQERNCRNSILAGLPPVFKGFSDACSSPDFVWFYSCASQC